MLVYLNIFNIERFCDAIHIGIRSIYFTTLDLGVIIRIDTGRFGNFRLLKSNKLSGLLKLVSDVLQYFFICNHITII